MLYNPKVGGLVSNGLNGLHMKTECFNYKVTLNRVGTFLLLRFYGKSKILEIYLHVRPRELVFSYFPMFFSYERF